MSSSSVTALNLLFIVFARNFHGVLHSWEQSLERWNKILDNTSLYKLVLRAWVIGKSTEQERASDVPERASKFQDILSVAYPIPSILPRSREHLISPLSTA